ncbi:hypothetical protein E4U43_006315 [Claviceps pusilla]|uniref:1-alkyl-2-acetylglycerophosphocholine esterase n=1 Tax=Claviceps pusilla TaxID=123648 RepID=A0A9P7N3J0_9HYPO|nr:hypothetical protein E4U43_006315 [Claviceps pusilla]
MKLLLPAPLLMLALPALATILVPPPRGPYDVAVKVLPLTDTSRPRDPYLLPPHSGGGGGGSSPQGRQLLLSVFLPVGAPHGDAPCPRITIPYMTPRVAADYGRQAAEAGLPADLYARFEVQVCDTAKLPRRSNCKAQTDKTFPVVLFTPGLQESRLLYGAGAQSLASEGYVVVTVDHVLEASLVEFPDGTVVPGRDNLLSVPIGGGDEAAAAAAAAAMKTVLVDVRTADLSFVIDQLRNDSLTEKLLGGPLLSRSLDLGKMVVYGHSLGGAAAANLVRADGRVRGGIDLDGQVVDPVRRLGLDRPFLLAGRYNHSGEDGTWDDVWPHLRGPRAEMAIRGTAHASFTDRPLLVSALRLPEQALKGLESLIGSVEGRRLETIVNDVLVGFWDYSLHHKDEGIRSLTEKYARQVFIPRSNL